MDSESERRLRLMQRIHKLHITARNVGAVNCLVEYAAYHVLECETSRPRAIWRYMRFAIRQQSYRAVDGFIYWRRYLWCRVRLMRPEQIAEKLDDQMMADLERMYGPTFVEDMAKIAEEDRRDV